MSNGRPSVRLKQIAVPNHCRVDWESMSGSGPARECGVCRTKVFDLSAMTEAEAEDLLSTSEDLCVRFFYRPDGTIVSSRCETEKRTAPSRVAAGLAASLAYGTAFSAITVALDHQPIVASSQPDVLVACGMIKLTLPSSHHRPNPEPLIQSMQSMAVADVRPSLASATVRQETGDPEASGVAGWFGGLISVLAALATFGTRRRWSAARLRTLDSWSAPQLTAVATLSIAAAAGVSVVGVSAAALCGFALGLAALIHRER